MLGDLAIGRRPAERRGQGGERGTAGREKRYFGGRDVFVQDTAEVWSSYVDLVDRIAGLAEMMAPPKKAKTRPGGPDASAPMTSVEERVACRAQTLADDARVRSFEIIASGSGR